MPLSPRSDCWWLDVHKGSSFVICAHLFVGIWAFLCVCALVVRAVGMEYVGGAGIFTALIYIKFTKKLLKK